jgi:hypothetical protein
MDKAMSQPTKTEVLAKLRRRYEGAGLERKGKLPDQARELPGYHRKSATRGLEQPGAGSRRRILELDGLIHNLDKPHHYQELGDINFGSGRPDGFWCNAFFGPSRACVGPVAA